MLTINLNVFKAYDIRGVYGQDFDNELAYLLGQAFVELRQSDPDFKVGKKLAIAVGYDMRLSSTGLKENLIRGLTAAGADAVDLGLVSTPEFYFAVAKYNYDGGLMVSASHNPKEWNGFKLVRAKGVPISGETGMKFLKEKVAANRFLPSKTPGQTVKNDTVLKDYLDYCLSFVDLNKLKPLKIAADTANGMGITYLEPLFEKLPGELIKINSALDGSFPAHEADPLKEENLIPLKNLIKTQGADFGIATDGDGDRLFFLDNNGETINPAIIRGLLAQVFLKDKPGAKIGYDVRPGKITVDMIEAAGGQAVVTRVGHSLIKEQMLKENLYFAGESSGHFYLNYPLGCFEYPPIIILKLLGVLSERGQKASDYLTPDNKYFSSGEINRAVKNPTAILDRLWERYADGRTNRLDGVSFAYPDYWFNVRASNTEPKIRLNLEAVDKMTMEKKRDEILNLIN